MTVSKLRTAVLVFCVGFALGVSVFAASRLFIRSVLTAEAVQSAETLARRLASGEQAPLASPPAISSYAYLDPNGDTIRSSGGLAGFDDADLRALADTASGSPLVSHSDLWPSLLGLADPAVRSVAVPVVDGGRRLGTLVADIDQGATLARLSRAFSTAGMVIVALVGLAGILVAGSMMWGRSAAGNRTALDIGRLRRDEVTGLLSREGFAQALHDAVLRAGKSDAQIGLMIVEVSRFRSVNDTWGHAMGDKVLNLVAERLKPFGRPAATMARISGASFALILESDVDSHSVRTLGRDIMQALSAPYEVDQASIALGANIGMALYPVNAENGEILFRAADVALSKAKAEGGQTLRFFDTEMAKVMKRRTRLERDLRLALDRNEFVVFYQPQLDLASGKLRGHEALVRWERPGEGIVPPGDFLAVAEETGLIRPLGEWVLRRACSDAATWLDAGTVAVNFSAAQFLDADLDRTISRILQETNLPPERLEIEVPETLFLEHSPDVMNTLMKIKALGVRIAMDDFGTGYSSLASLARFPFDKIKIDRSFVSQLAEDPGVAAIVSSIVGLGRSLSVDITAEGVETREQVTLLQAAGCSSVQGFLFGAPQRVHAEAVLDQPQPVASLAV